jgi:ornithine cyclodeaminase
MVRYLTDDDVKQLISMPRALALVEEAWRARALGRACDVARSRVPTPHGIMNMLAAEATDLGYVGFKYYYSTKRGATRHVHLVDAASGRLAAIIEADWLGSMRTGAASGVAGRHLARRNARRLGQIGAGAQAATQIAAVHHALGIESVRVYARTKEKLLAFCETVSRELGIEVLPADSAQSAVRNADVINVITRSSSPVLLGEWLEPGQHVNAAGSNALDRQEVDARTVQRSEVITVDARATAQNECGDLAPLVARDELQWDQLVEIGDVIAGKAAGRTNERQISLFESQGMGLQDLYVAVEVLQTARERKVGVDLPLGA